MQLIYLYSERSIAEKPAESVTNTPLTEAVFYEFCVILKSEKHLLLWKSWPPVSSSTAQDEITQT